MKHHIITSGFILLGGMTLLAAPTSSETFGAYTVGQKLNNQNPTVTGYVDPWQTTNHGTGEPAVIAGNLNYGGVGYAQGAGDKIGKGADTVGINATNSGRVSRLLDSAYVVTSSTEKVLYLSWLYRTGNENAAPQANIYQALGLYNGSATSDANRVFDGGNASGDYGTSNYGFRVNNTTPGNLGVAADSNVHLFVAKFTLSATNANDQVQVWLDPTLGGGDPSGGVTVSGVNFIWDRLVLAEFASNSSQWDEIRWGDTFASVTSEAALPTVPTFVTQPSDVNQAVGTNLSLTAAAQSDPAPTYQWEKSADGVSDWAVVSGQTNSTLTLSAVTYAASGYYRLKATNGNGSGYSNAASVSLYYPTPTIVTQPSYGDVALGSNAQLRVVATGYGTLSYQWYKDGELLTGETSSTLDLPNVSAATAGTYWVSVIDPAGEVDGFSAAQTDSNNAVVSTFALIPGLLSHDPFVEPGDYAVGELSLQNPAISGYQGSWTEVDYGSAQPAIASGSLVYSHAQYLGSTGGKVAVPNNTTGGETAVSNSGRVYRLLDAPLKASPIMSGVRYLSFLYQNGIETGATIYQCLQLNRANGDAFRCFDFGLTQNFGGGNQYAFSVNGEYAGFGVNANTNVHLVVIKFEMGTAPGSDQVTAWLDPVPGNTDPAGGVVLSGKNLEWDRLVLSDYDGNSAAWDEVRWGTSFESVTLQTAPTFASWIAGFPGVGTLTGFSDDADGDGLKNGVESLLGTNPSVGNPGLTEVARSGNTVNFVHAQASNLPSDVLGSYVWSTDLQTFHASGDTAEGITVTAVAAAHTPQTGLTTVTATVQGTMPPKLFFALKAAQSSN